MTLITSRASCDAKNSQRSGNIQKIEISQRSENSRRSEIRIVKEAGIGKKLVSEKTWYCKNYRYRKYLVPVKSIVIV